MLRLVQLVTKFGPHSQSQANVSVSVRWKPEITHSLYLENGVPAVMEHKSSISICHGITFQTISPHFRAVKIAQTLER